MFTETCLDSNESSSGYVGTTYVYLVNIYGSNIACKHIWF